ncbi:hypothetical protein D4R52_01245, partial [bacterium]
SNIFSNIFNAFVKKKNTLQFGMIIEKIVRLLNESARQANMVVQTKCVDKLPPIICNQSDMEQVLNKKSQF